MRSTRNVKNVDPLSCGFAKIAVYNIFRSTQFKRLQHETVKVFKSRVFKCRFDEYNKYFHNQNAFQVPYKKFVDKFPSIVDNMRDLAKRNNFARDELLDIFSSEKWEKLGEQRNKHMLFDCQSCIRSNKPGLSKFLIKNNMYKVKAEKAGLFKEAVLADVTNRYLNELNSEFSERFGTTFATQVKKKI